MADLIECPSVPSDTDNSPSRHSISDSNESNSQSLSSPSSRGDSEPPHLPSRASDWKEAHANELGIVYESEEWRRFLLDKVGYSVQNDELGSKISKSLKGMWSCVPLDISPADSCRFMDILLGKSKLEGDEQRFFTEIAFGVQDASGICRSYESMKSKPNVLVEDMVSKSGIMDLGVIKYLL